MVQGEMKQKKTRNDELINIMQKAKEQPGINDIIAVYGNASNILSYYIDSNTLNHHTYLNASDRSNE